MPNVRTQPTPAIPQPRGVEDAAPYGRLRDEGISIAVNKCVNATNLRPPLGSPERGAVAALCAVTEGLVQRWCGVITSPVNRGRAGVEARPYGVVGRYPELTDAGLNPSVTALCAATAPLAGEPRAWAEVVTFAQLLTTMRIPTSRTRP